MRQRAARASNNFGVPRQCDPAKYKMRRIGAGLGRIRARRLRVAARGGSGALAGSARWLRASRGGARCGAGCSATHLVRNAGRPGAKTSRPRQRADGRRRRGLNPSSHSQKTRWRPRSFILFDIGFSRCETRSSSSSACRAALPCHSARLPRRGRLCGGHRCACACSCDRVRGVLLC